MLKPGVSWGKDGVRQMLNACKECGWSRIHWRVLDGGRALYKSKLLQPMGQWDKDSFWSPQSEADKALIKKFSPGMTEEKQKELLQKFDKLDYAHFDPLAEAVLYGHSIGLEIWAWVTVNEDDHGWGLQSEFSKKHPQFRWQHRNGKPYYSQLSFVYPEVRKYKLKILEELMANYKLDGFFLDWIRTGDVRDNPQNDPAGVADYGYEKPLLEKWRKRTGKKDATALPANDDEAWTRLRAEPQTEFMREVRGWMNHQRPRLPIAAMVGHPWHYRGMQDPINGNLRGLLLDVHTWSREGLMNAVVAAGYYRTGGNAESAYRALYEETEGRVDVWDYAWVPQNVADLNQTLAVAGNLGAKQVLFWEADYIADRPNAAELKQAMRDRAMV